MFQKQRNVADYNDMEVAMGKRNQTVICQTQRKTSSDFFETMAKGGKRRRPVKKDLKKNLGSVVQKTGNNVTGRVGEIE